jgi:endonuclease-3
VPEAIATKSKRIAAILDRLERAYPDAEIELDYGSPLELLVAVILSAQCTDKRVNLVTPKLFARYRSAADYAASTAEEVARYIQSCGLYRNKAKNIVAMARELVAAHGGEVPASRAALSALPGVGAKTARRMGLTTATDPRKIEVALQRLVPRERWGLGHQLLIFHGRRRCFARSPDCAGCEVKDLCPKRGVKQIRSKR